MAPVKEFNFDDDVLLELIFNYINKNLTVNLNLLTYFNFGIAVILGRNIFFLNPLDLFID